MSEKASVDHSFGSLKIESSTASYVLPAGVYILGYTPAVEADVLIHSNEGSQACRWEGKEKY